MTATIGTIGAMMRFPVKSLMGEHIDACDVTLTGLDGDRCYALVDVATGKIASAKQPNLWRDLLKFSASTSSSAGQHAITVSDISGGAVGDLSSGFDEKLSALLGRQVRLIDVRPAGIELNRARPDEVLIDGEDTLVTQDLLVIAAAAPNGGFFDFAPIHLMTSTSLDAIAAAAPNASIIAQRYRPNIIIDSASLEPFAENDWVGRRIQIGQSVALEIIAPTPRCAVPMLAQGSHPRSPEAVGVVTRLNKVECAILGPGTFPCLGAYATVVASGRIERGDQVVLS